MRSGDYSSALLLVTERVAGVIAQDAGIQIPNVPPPARGSADAANRFICRWAAIIVLIVILVIMLATPLRGVLFWLLLSQLGGRGGGWGGGGFGGGWRGRRLWRFWRRQFRRRRGKQQLVEGEDDDGSGKKA